MTMRTKDFRIGPGASSLILIVLVLCLSVLGLLTLSGARGDERLSARAANVAESAAKLNVAAEESLAALYEALKNDTALPEGMTREGDTVAWTLTDEDGRTLSCAVRVAENGRPVWTEHRLLTESGIELEDIW